MVNLDDRDRAIITNLRNDGRMSYKDIGENIGFTIMGVKRRFLKLVDEDTINVAATENVNKLKYKLALILLEIENQETLQNVLERFKGCPRAVYVFTLLSGYNLAVLTVAEDQDTLESESWEKCSWRSQVGIRRSEFYPIGEIYYSPFIPIREELMSGEASTAPCGVNCEKCGRYDTGKCLGCPATKYYRKRNKE
jgi:DNA-binding Lrp family transcriptional regulator